MFPQGPGGQFPPRGFPPVPFNAALPPPGFPPPQNSRPNYGGPGMMRPDVPGMNPRLNLQMILQIPMNGQQHHQPPQQQPYPNLPPLLGAQQPYRPPQPPQSHFQGFNQPPRYGFQGGGLLSGGGQDGGMIPGLCDNVASIEKLRALETILKDVSRGTWAPPGAAPSALPHPAAHQQESSDAALARQSEAFIRELQSRNQFELRYGRDDDSRRRRRSSSTSSGSEDAFGNKRRRAGDSDLEEGEVPDEVPDTRFMHHHQQPQHLPPPLFGSNQPHSSYGSIAPLLPTDESHDRDQRDRNDRGRGRGRNKNYHDLDAQDGEDKNGQGAGASSKNAAPSQNSFDSLFSAYLRANEKSKTSKDETPTAEAPPSPPPPAPAQHPHMVQPQIDAHPLSLTVQQALSALGIQVPFSAPPPMVHHQQRAPINTAPSLSYALSAFDRDIAQIGGVTAAHHLPQRPVVEEPSRPLGAGLPPNVVVEVAGDSSDLAAVAEEITSQLDKPGDQIYANHNMPREIFPSRDNRATVATVQKMIPPIPMIERENVAKRVEEGMDYSTVPLLLPTKIVEERVFPPLKDTKVHEQKFKRRGPQEPAAPGWSKSELHEKLKQARERVNHLKIEQSMVEERMTVMGEELRKLHRYFESNYGVKLVRPVDLEDPSELTALWKRREEDAKKRAQLALENQDALSEAGSAMVYGPEPMINENSNEQPDENGPQDVDEHNFSAMEDQEESNEGLDASDRLLKDRREVNRRGRDNKRTAREDGPSGFQEKKSRNGKRGNHPNRKNGSHRGGFGRGGRRN